MYTIGNLQVFYLKYGKHIGNIPHIEWVFKVFYKKANKMMLK
jgi:hypothetical protein